MSKRERDWYRNLPGDAGAVQRSVWGRDEDEFEEALNAEASAAPAPPPASVRGGLRRKKRS